MSDTSTNGADTEHDGPSSSDFRPLLIRRVSPLDHREVGARFGSPRTSVVNGVGASVDTGTPSLLRRSSSSSRLYRKTALNISPIVTTQSLNDLHALAATASKDSPLNSVSRVHQTSEESNHGTPTATPLESPRSVSLSLPLPGPVVPVNALAPLAEELHSPPTLDAVQSAASKHSISVTSPDPVSVSALSLPIVPVTLPIDSLPSSGPHSDLMKNQLDGVLKKRGDSFLNLVVLDSGASQLIIPMPLNLRLMSGGADRRVTFRVDTQDGLDLVDLIHEEQISDDDTDVSTAIHHHNPKKFSPVVSPSRHVRGILKTVNIRGTDEERRRRNKRAATREHEWIRVVQNGALLTKYSWRDAKPQKRWVYVTGDGLDICWEKPNNQWNKSPQRNIFEDGENDSGNESKRYTPLSTRAVGTVKSEGNIHATNPHVTSAVLALSELGGSARLHSEERRKRRSSLPSAMSLFFKLSSDRTRSLIDVSGIHYGPFRSTRFKRYLARKDAAAGLSWLCFTVVFQDRTLDLVCDSESQVTAWFMGCQALAPLSVHHLTLGGLLWQRLVMKLNHFGLMPIKQERISTWNCDHPY